MKLFEKLYSAAVILLLSAPLTGMLVWPTTETAEKKELASWPSLVSEQGFNTSFLPEAGAYFEDHFAFKEHLITANSLLYTRLLQTSPLERVIYGKNGTLYYQETLDDYLGQNLLSDRQIHNIVHNCQLMSSYTASRGSQFALVIVPNKNTVIPDRMPDWALQGTEKNKDRLEQALREQKILYVDLSQALQEEQKKEDQYYQKDTHWNTQGALTGYRTLMQSLGLESRSYDLQQAETVAHESDLDAMLTPKHILPEEELVFGSHNWSYVTDTEDNMDEWIQTHNDQASGSLLMYRDSFAEALVPLLSDSFADAWYSRLLPYNLSQIEQLHPEFVIIERAERRLASLQEAAAIQPLPVADVPVASEKHTDTRFTLSADGSWNHFSGTVPADLLEAEDTLCVRIAGADGSNPVTLSLFQTDGDGEGNGFDGYLPQSLRPAGDCQVQILVVREGQAVSVCNEITQWERKTS